MDRTRTSPARAVSAFAVLLAGSCALLVPASARAVPSFARQTGLQCSSCHTAFPQLTPLGRYFKLTGYVMSDGKSHLPPVAAMVQAPAFTHTRKDQPGGAAPDFGNNDNVALNQASGFYAGRLLGPYATDLFGPQAGKVLDHLGTFIQGTYDGVGDEWAWDNSEIRAATETTVKGHDVVVGAYLNNNPSMQDLWNTTPAWGFPFSSSGLAPEAAAAPLLAGGLAQQVAGVGAYGMFADHLYVELGGYDTLSGDLQEALGVDPTGEARIDGMAPYWRVALQGDWGHHDLEVGTYGLRADTFPARIATAGHDRITDLGFDTQYQYLSDMHDVGLLLNFLHERADWNASLPLGLTSRASDDLWSFTATATYLFDKKYGVDFQYFLTDGDKDALLYGTRTGSPLTRGWMVQLDYLPLNRRGGPSFWPKSNLKLSLQYVHYDRFDGARRDFDGSGRDAGDNDTLYLQAWLAF
jgi:hypothetical protein